MTWEIFLTALLIMVARIADVSLGTFRFVCVINGRRVLAWLVAFFEAAIWVFAASKVLTNLDNPFYAVAFSIGFATGTFLGMTAESYVALGEQVVRVFTTRGEAVADGLRHRGFRVTQFEGKGRDGPVDLLFIQVQRREAGGAAAAARELDPDCFYVVDDVRAASVASAAKHAVSHGGAGLRK